MIKISPRAELIGPDLYSVTCPVIGYAAQVTAPSGDEAIRRTAAAMAVQAVTWRMQ